ncbi:MAG: OmpA family protein, partial [Deltaproteobacteria bacterium]|nr:OmpA family protein [Deltaproteobacteria bacterium]
NIQVEGHTDDVPIRSRQFPSNWELSSARALAVLRLLLEKSDIEPERLSAAGYGEYHPNVPNDSSENRRLNRRVDIVIVPGST